MLKNLCASFCLCFMVQSACGMGQSYTVYADELGRVVATALGAAREKLPVPSGAMPADFTQWGGNRLIGLVGGAAKGAMGTAKFALRHPGVAVIVCLVATTALFTVSAGARSLARKLLNGLWQRYKRRYPDNIFSQFASFMNPFGSSEEITRAGFVQKQELEKLRVAAEERNAALTAREEALGCRLNALDGAVDHLQRVISALTLLSAQVEAQNRHLTVLDKLVQGSTDGTERATGLTSQIESCLRTSCQHSTEIKKLWATTQGLSDHMARVSRETDERVAQTLDTTRHALVHDLDSVLGQHGFSCRSDGYPDFSGGDVPLDEVVVD